MSVLPVWRFRTAWFAIASAVLFTSFSGVAVADEITEIKEKLQAHTVRLAQLEKKDNDLQSAIEDIKLAQFWLNEAQAQLIKEEEDVAKQYLRRVEVALEMIDSIVETAKVEKTAFERESAAIAMEKEAFESKTKLDEVTLQERQLMKQVTSGEKKEGNK